MENVKKHYINWLGLILTNTCNFDCDHCLHGEKDNESMSNEIIDAILEQIGVLEYLSVCGGETTLALDRLEYLINQIIERKLRIDGFSVTINGSNYSEEFLRLLAEINNYITNLGIKAVFAISKDIYHTKQAKKLDIFDEYLENIRRYQESKYFCGFRTLTKKAFREGNAVNLDRKLTVPLRPMQKYVTYLKSCKYNNEEGVCMLGPIVSVNPHGIITECDASERNQQDLYNYGNVLVDTFEEAFLNNGAKIVNVRKYNKNCNKEYKRYLKYNK